MFAGARAVPKSLLNMTTADTDALRRTQTQDHEEREQPLEEKPTAFDSINFLGENLVGSPEDRLPQHDDVRKVIRIVEDAGISCCFVGAHALIYYGAGRVAHVSYHIRNSDSIMR